MKKYLTDLGLIIWVSLIQIMVLSIWIDFDEIQGAPVGLVMGLFSLLFVGVGQWRKVF